MEESYGSAGRGVRKSLTREHKKHKQRTAQTGVRYNTLRAGAGLIVRMAEAQVPKPGKHPKKGGKWMLKSGKSYRVGKNAVLAQPWTAFFVTNS